MIFITKSTAFVI